MRLLDVGCGWGGMVLHAAEHHGVRAVGVTISRRQAELAEKRVGRGRAVDQASRSACRTTARSTDGPYDAISSIGMFEHVGEARLGRVLRPAARAAAPAAAGCSTTASAGPSGQRARLPAPQLRQPLRVPRRRAARGRPGGVDRAGRRVRGPPRRDAARALRPHAAAVGGQPRGQLGRGGRGGRRGPGPGVAPLHGGVGDQLRGRAARRSTRCSPCRSPTTADRACRCARSSSEPVRRRPAAGVRRAVGRSCRCRSRRGRRSGCRRRR